MSEFKLHRLGMLMEPEPGNPQEVEGVLNPEPFAALMASFTSFRDWLRREIIRASGLRACGSMKPAIRQAWRGLASRLSPKPNMSGGPMAAVAARTPASRSLSRSSATS